LWDEKIQEAHALKECNKTAPLTMQMRRYREMVC